MSWITRLIDCIFGNPPSTSEPSKNPPKFIEYGGNIVLPSPDSLTNSLMYNFFFTSNGGDKSKLQAVLDQRLNFPENSNFRYQAFAADVMLTFATTEQDRSIPKKDLGFVAEKEVVCWIPCIEQVKKGGKWVSNRFVWFVPYIVVDSVWALTAGREIFGFPKSMGQFDIPTDPQNAATFTSTIAGFKTFSKDSKLQDLPFLSINRQPDSVSDGKNTTPFDDGPHASTSLKNILLDAKDLWDDLSFRFCIHETEDLLDMRLFWVFLKQFRSFDSSTTACYQAIAEGPLHIKKFHGGGLLHGLYELTINDLASAPIAEELGLSSGQLARASSWVNIDFVANLGKELWKA